MKLYRYILLLVIFVIYGCEQRISPDERNEENLVATNGYIFFDTERVTRGTPIENYLYEDFHVIGYQYSGEWTTVRPQTSQNNAGVFEKCSGIFSAGSNGDDITFFKYKVSLCIDVSFKSQNTILIVCISA